MGFLSFFAKSSRSRLVRLPSGSFTLDKDGRLMTSTLPQAFPEETLQCIGEQVLASFESARKAQMPMAEIIVHYATLKVLARELRGGAIIFLMPVR
jgi:hypothetical protein